MTENQALKTFIIYARDDKAYKDQLLRHLRPLVSSEYLSVWHDGDILPGEDWEKKIKTNLKASQLVLVLVSVNCLNSDFIEGEELNTAVERLKDGHTRIVPIIISPCGWRYHKLFVGLQGLPEDMKPVSNWANPDQAWTDVVESLAKMVEEHWAEQAVLALQQKQKEDQEIKAALATERFAQESAAAAERERIDREQRDRALAEQQRLADLATQKAAERSRRQSQTAQKPEPPESKEPMSNARYNTWIGLGITVFLVIVLIILDPWKCNQTGGEDKKSPGTATIQPDTTRLAEDEASQPDSTRPAGSGMTPLHRDQIDFDHARQAGTVNAWEQFISRYPDSPKKQEAMNQLIALRILVNKRLKTADDFIKLNEPREAIKVLKEVQTLDPDNGKIAEKLRALSGN